MKSLLPTTTFGIALLAMGSCAAQSGPQSAAQPVVQAPPVALTGPASRAIEFPGAPGDGEPREVHLLVDEPALKLVSIVLRDGTVLPPHDADVPVTIMALQGSGTVIAGSERLRLDPEHAVLLGPNVSHAVEPGAGTDLVLLVHYLRLAKEHQP